MHLLEKNQLQNKTIIDQSPGLCAFSNLTSEDNELQREIVLTNQEGKLCYVTCYEYFVDMKCIMTEYLTKQQKLFHDYVSE